MIKEPEDEAFEELEKAQQRRELLVDKGCAERGCMGYDSREVLRVTKDGQFIWHEDADRMIEEGDFSFSPAMPHILKALRKQRKPLTDEEIWGAYMKAPVDIDCHVSDLHKFARAIEAAHGIKGEA